MPVGAVPFPFGKCRICKDRATGIHYGVATCEGCKGFFKRSIAKAEKYKCFFGGECDITPKNRNRCKSCRFRLCLENGMSVEAVRMGRIPKIEKEKALEAVVTEAGDKTSDTYHQAGKKSADYHTYDLPVLDTEPSGPDIYDFDTGCISRQSRTVAKGSDRTVSETASVASLQDSVTDTMAPIYPLPQPQIPVAIDNDVFKSEHEQILASSEKSQFKHSPFSIDNSQVNIEFKHKTFGFDNSPVNNDFKQGSFHIDNNFHTDNSQVDNGFKQTPFGNDNSKVNGEFKQRPFGIDNIQVDKEFKQRPFGFDESQANNEFKQGPFGIDKSQANNEFKQGPFGIDNSLVNNEFKLTSKPFSIDDRQINNEFKQKPVSFENSQLPFTTKGSMVKTDFKHISHGTGKSGVKNELGDTVSKTCCKSLSSGGNSKSSSMEIHECSKEIEIMELQKQSNTNQFSSMLYMDLDNTTERNPILDKNKFEHFETRVSCSNIMTDNFGKVSTNPAHFSFADTVPSFDNSSQFYCTESPADSFSPFDPRTEKTQQSFAQSKYNRPSFDNLNFNSMTDCIMGTPQESQKVLQNSPRKEFEMPVIKTECLNIPDDNRNPNQVSVNQQHDIRYGGLDYQRTLTEMLPDPPGTLVNPEISDKKAAEFPRPERGGSVLSVPPSCPTPSSVDGSTTSSQRGRFSPGLIKVLLEQVLDTTQENDVVVRLKQRLEQNKMGKTVVANVLNLIREVSAKRNNKLGGSEDVSILSAEESSTNETASLSENKMESIQRFLEDVNKFSGRQSLASPPFSQKSNSSYSTFNTFERQESVGDSNNALVKNKIRQDSGIDIGCSPLKKRYYQQETKCSTSEQQEMKPVLGGTYQCKFGLNDGLVSLQQHTAQETTIDKEPIPVQNTQSDYRFPAANMSLTPTEQIQKVDSSENHSDLTQNTSVLPSDLIEQSINDNRVTCSDDKLSREEVKKQVIHMTMEGLSVASKILHRWKPEHRETLRLHKLGLLKVKVFTDSEEDIKVLYTQIIKDIPSVNDRILGFCERVPGFSSINAEDRGVLMKRAYYDIWMLHSAEYFYDGEVHIILLSGSIYAKKPMEKILNKEIVATLEEFANSFNKLHLNDLEVSILCAVRLTCSDDLEVKNRSTIQKLHSLMLDVLAIEIERNHPDNHTRLLIDIFRLMPLLANANKAQSNIIAKYSVDKPVFFEECHQNFKQLCMRAVMTGETELQYRQIWS